MPRYKLLVEYDGTPFAGWQAQSNAPSVQGTIEAAVLAVAGEATRIRGAGRTDKGVHASGQVAHLDLAKAWSPRRLGDAINALLRPAPIAILDVELVADGFDARFSAVNRVYRYVILNRRAPPALGANRVWHVMRRLDEAAMQRAARALIGHHDFTTFRNVDCQAKSPMKTLKRLDVWREGEHVLFETEARSFLHNQVRSVVGSLKCVGSAAKPESWIAEILAARDRARCGALSPPEGLTLVRVDYAASQADQCVGDPADEEADDEV